MSRNRKVTIHTDDGESRTVTATDEDARALEELPFTSSNVAVVTVEPAP